MKTIKEYCKEMKIKFESKTENGFIGSWIVYKKAGMKFNSSDYKLKNVTKKRVFWDFLVLTNGDIIFNGEIKELCIYTTIQ